MLIEQLIDLRKVLTENLKFWTDLWDVAMGGWSVTQKMIVYQGRLLKKSVIQKSEAHPVKQVFTSLSYTAFHLLHIRLQTLNAIDSESFQTLFPSFLSAAIWSHCAIIFKSDQNQQMPFLRQEVDVDLLRWFDPEDAILFLYPFCFTQKPMTHWKKLIEGEFEAIGATVPLLLW